MKIISAHKLREESTRRTWEGSQGHYVLDSYAEVKTSASVFDHVVETKGSRVVRPGELYDALSAQFPGRTGGHPFEVVSVREATSFTVKFRSGYSSRPIEAFSDAEDDDNDDEN